MNDQYNNYSMSVISLRKSNYINMKNCKKNVK